MECRGYCTICKTPCDNDDNFNHEQCSFCRQMVHKDEGSRYTDSIYDKIGKWVCDACVARGVFDEIEEEAGVAI